MKRMIQYFLLKRKRRKAQILRLKNLAKSKILSSGKNLSATSDIYSDDNDLGFC